MPETDEDEGLLWRGTADEGAWNVRAEVIESNPYRCILVVTRAGDDKEILREEVDNDLDLWSHMVIGAIDHFEAQKRSCKKCTYEAEGKWDGAAGTAHSAGCPEKEDTDDSGT